MWMGKKSEQTKRNKNKEKQKQKDKKSRKTETGEEKRILVKSKSVANSEAQDESLTASVFSKATPWRRMYSTRSRKQAFTLRVDAQGGGVRDPGRVV